MPRDINGVYTLPAGNPVIPNTIIATNWANTTMDDIAAALTASLSIDGSVTTAKLANGAVTTIKIADANVTRPKLSSDVALGVIGKNHFLNGSLSIWQDTIGLASGTGNRYSADLFLNSSIGTTYIVDRANWPVGQTNVDPSAVYFTRHTVTSVAGAANFYHIELPMENVRTLAGKQITISFWGRCNTATQPIAVEIVQVFGSGGSAQVTQFVSQASLTTSWQRFAFTTTVPSISGKTIGTDPNCLLLVIWLDAGSNYNSRTGSLGQRSGSWDFWGIKVEEGSSASTYKVEPVSYDYLRCCRYYYKPSSGISVGPLTWSGDATTGLNYHAPATFPTEMYYSPNMTYIDGFSTGFPATTSSTTQNIYGCRFSKLCNSTGGARIWSGTFIADARF